MKGFVISLFDESGNMVRPWAEAGYTCICIDIQNKDKMPELVGKGMITYRSAFINESYIHQLASFWRLQDVKMVFGFPPCTDLAVSGAAHFEKKRQANPTFQKEATATARCVELLGSLLGVPWFAENPVSVLATTWRKPDQSFQPCEYGGYLPANDVHPRWPDYIAPRDAYNKKTCLWTGNGFKMPEKKPVSASGYSQQHLKLGGKSAKTKQIRSETPRGFALAVFKANGDTK